MAEAPIETIYREAATLQDELETVAKAYHLAINDLKHGRMDDGKRVRRSLAHLENEVATLDSLQARAERLYEAARKRVNEIRAFGLN